MPLPQSFKAMVVRETEDKQFPREITQRTIDDLPEGDVVIEVQYSSLNYKDALSATGNKGVTRKYPHTPGIDAAGAVVESRTSEFANGDEVVVTGFDLGANTPGGYGQYIRVPAAWIVKLPDGLTLKESMIFGTAGVTAAMSVHRLQKLGVKPQGGDVLVTGATGGVGCLAVAMLAASGYSVVASTGKAGETDFLTSLGAKTIISRDDADDKSGRPLSKSVWAGVVDTVGGNILATALKSTQYGGVVTCCGNVASGDLPTTVYPFILRDVTLVGIGSADCPMALRLTLWKKMSREWKLDSLASLSTECSLEELDDKIDLILQGKIKGRVVVNLTT